jgi:hypothetical protein
MPSYVDLETLTGFGAEADAALAKVVRAVMQANTWKVTGSARFQAGATGYALHVEEPATLVRIAKNGGMPIPAMSGSTPGSGTVTLYRMGTTALATTGITLTAYNMHPTGTVEANAWLKIVRIDAKDFVFWEPC